ncbi:aminopeptidase N [Streptomyces albus subsp. chlorinus]|uniref:aminopeptidase N n=1 Tax=Streptomyces albus TaxID=1888 RepID=UPI0015710693|nr:aminopeptidase N [Streptomyces albus]NSC21072.1 aminopeptidase N [Streptomyces albus subsp. chlorinus]
MVVLTRAEAESRARVVRVERYEVDLDLTRGEKVFASRTVVRFIVTEEGAGTFVEVRPTELVRVELDGAALDPGELREGRLPLRALPAGEHVLRVEALMPYSRLGEGMHRFTDPEDGETYVYTMCCMADAPLVFACFDQPDLKAEFHVSVTAPTEWTVLGNGVATRTGPGRWECAPTPPISTYLMAVAAGPFHSVRTEHAGLPFGLHVRRSLGPYLEADAAELLEITRRCFDRYHEIFDEPYPFDSYDQAFVPEFNSGAMENPGLVTFRDEFIHRSAVTDTERQTRGMVIAHEMAHMWFGDLVTLRWWDDIWLNESFAEYMGYQVLSESTRFTDTWTDFAVERKCWGYDADERPSTHPVAPDAEGVPDTEAARGNFDGISYAKGASALRQLVVWLGEKSFLAGINDHFARHRFGNATLADFLDSLARASDRDVRAWADSWLRTTGVDTLVPRVGESEQKRWYVDVEHRGERPHRLAVGLYDRAPADESRLVLRERLERDVPPGGGRLTVTLEGPRPDLVLVNDLDWTYAKVRLDPVSWGTVRAALSGLPGQLSRAVVWNAARDMVRDAELGPLEYVRTVRAHLPRESDDAVVQGVLAFARGHAADRFLGGAERTEALGLLSEVCRELLAGTAGAEGTEGGVGAAGSARAAGVAAGAGGGPGAVPASGSVRGVRLTAARYFIDCATSPQELLAWRAAGEVPGGGPVLDAELRWRLLLRLSVLGAVDAAEIDRARVADASARGEEWAARCRAALPDAAGKQAAWEAMFGPADALSNYLFTATAQGFWQPEQVELLRGYAGRYFAEVVPLAARRGPALAEVAGRYAFPVPVVEEETLARGEECLASGGLVPALRRRLEDQIDDLRRALAVRAAAG